MTFSALMASRPAASDLARSRVYPHVFRKRRDAHVAADTRGSCAGPDGGSLCHGHGFTG